MKLTRRLNIIFKDVSDFGKINAIGIHSKNDTVNGIIDAIERADKDMFPAIYIYSSKPFDKYSNIKSASTWSRLRKALPDLDIRCGLCTLPFGQVLGQGFFIYL